MEADQDSADAVNEQRRVSKAGLWIGLVAGAAALAWMSTRSGTPPARRYSDRGQERRNPLHFFLAGQYPHRRSIDRSGARPLFERRQSVYDTY